MNAQVGPAAWSHRGPAVVARLLAPRRSGEPYLATAVLHAVTAAAALAQVYAAHFPAGWVRFQAQPHTHGVRLARHLGRAVVAEARAADLFPLLPAARLDAMERELACDELPFYVWSIPFGDDYLYRAQRGAVAGRLERLLHVLALLPYVGRAAALEQAGLDPVPTGPNDALAPLLALLAGEEEQAITVASRLTTRDAERLYAWYGSPCLLLPTLIAYMQQETGNPFLDWEEETLDDYQQAAEANPFAWEVETVATFAALFNEARQTLARLQPLWAALADAGESQRLADAIALALGVVPRRRARSW